MSGEIAALGKWDPAKAVRMEWSDNMHAYTTTIPLEPASHLNYKYALCTLCVCHWAEKRKGRIIVYITNGGVFYLFIYIKECCSDYSIPSL
jgi:hypothetical protein